MRLLSSIWAFRHFVLASIRGELRARFARSSLGASWFILHPVAQTAIFALVLSEVLAAKLPGVDGGFAFAVYLLAGMAAWGLFSEILNRCMTIFIEYAGAMKKISFPRLCLPLIVGGGALLNHMLLLAAIGLMCVLLGYAPGIAWLALPACMILTAALAFGLGVLLGIFNVFMRDVGQVFAVVLQIWFWLTPIVYPLTALPERVRWLVELNPLSPLVSAYQQVILYRAFPDWGTLALPAAIAAGMVALSFAVFRRASAEIVDVL